MKIIKCLSEKIEEELHDADEYIQLAMTWKNEEPEAAEVFYQLSTEEMGHADKLHAVVAKLIGRYQEENGDPPKGMQALYDYLHQKQIATAMSIKVRPGLYREA